jgi:hypothetical protein
MLEHVFRSHERIQELRKGPQGSLLEGFAEELTDVKARDCRR